MTLEDAISAVLDNLKVIIGKPDWGFGVRTSLFAKMNNPYRGLTQVEIYAEYVVPVFPRSMVGYTMEEMKVQEGVSILTLNGTNKNTGPYTGNVMTFDRFLDEHITNPGNRLRLTRRMDELKVYLRQTDEVLEQAMDIWMQRNPGQIGFVAPRYLM